MDKKEVAYKLGTMCFVKPRNNPEKPGRELFVIYDERFPVIPGFKVRYSYYVQFFEKGSVAGNHYHEKKREAFVPILGNFVITLEDVKKKVHETVILKSEDNGVFYINTKVAHKVTAKDENSKLLVLATSPNEDDDEFPYLM